MKAISLRLDEDMLDEIREVSKIYNITATELIREGIKNILNNKKIIFISKYSKSSLILCKDYNYQ
mgnify:CR=1 FL=1